MLIQPTSRGCKMILSAKTGKMKATSAKKMFLINEIDAPQDKKQDFDCKNPSAPPITVDNKNDSPRKKPSKFSSRDKANSFMRYLQFTKDGQFTKKVKKHFY